MQYISFLHLATDWFALGRSSVKIFLLAGALVLLFAMNVLVRKREKFPWDNWLKKIEPKNLFFAVSGMIFLFGLSVTFWYYHLLSIPANYLPMAIGERNVSMTHFFHTHVLKFSFGLISSFLPQGFRLFLESRADFGFAFLGILPDWVGVVGFTGFVIISILGLWLLFDFVRENKKRIGLQILFVVVLISTLKNMFDGGLLNSETISALTVLWILSFGLSPKKSWQIVVPIILQTIPLVAVAIACPMGAINFSDIPVYLERLYGLELIFFGWIFFTEKGVLKKYTAILLIIAGIYFISPAFSLSAEDISYSHTELSGKEVFFVTYDSNAPGTLMEKIDGLYFYRFSTTSPMTVGDLASIVGDQTSYYPIAIEDPSCRNPNNFSIEEFPVISKEPLLKSIVIHKLANIDSLGLVGEKNGWYYYTVKIFTYPCVPQTLDVIRALLEEAGGVHIVFLESVKGSSITY